jgi:hypothetical protein
MQFPFDIEVNGVPYAVFPEEDDTYTIYKEGQEYMRIQKDTEQQWLKLHEETDLPIFTENAEVNAIGEAIANHKETEEDEEEEDLD